MLKGRFGPQIAALIASLVPLGLILGSLATGLRFATGQQSAPSKTDAG